MSRALSLVLLLILGAGCDIFRGPSPLNDAPVIERFGAESYVNDMGEVINTRSYVTIAVGQTASFQIVATEPEDEELTLAVGPIPRGWSYDADSQTLTAAPDEAQRNLMFTLYIAAEDAHTPPAYDVRVLEFTVY